MTDGFTDSERSAMARALQLAASARFVAAPNPAVGCVLVRDGQVIGEGATASVGNPHAERAALADAKRRQQVTDGASAFVTLEPCCHHGRTPPCTDALIEANIGEVIFAIADPDPRVNGSGRGTLEAAGIPVRQGLLAESATKHHRFFLHRSSTGKPWVRVKLASSVDGRTAMASGESMWISGQASRRDVQLLRAEADCVLSGSGTVLADNPSLDVRLSAQELSLPAGTAVRQPLRVLVDSQLRVRPDAKLFYCGGDVKIYTDGIKSNIFNELGDKVEVISTLGAEAGGIDLQRMLDHLGQYPVNLVHVEAGATLCGALLSAGLVDEIVLYLAPHLMGNKARPQFVLPAINNMSERHQLSLEDVRQVGDDLRLTYHPVA